MGQTARVQGRATSISTAEGRTTVRYRNTDVVTFDAYQIELFTGGWNTVTTRARMNQAANEFKLDYRVWQKDGRLYVGTNKPGPAVEFQRRAIIQRQTGTVESDAE